MLRFLKIEFLDKNLTFRIVCRYRKIEMRKFVSKQFGQRVEKLNCPFLMKSVLMKYLPVDM